MLYTREFFEVVKSHLNPGGVGHAVRAAVREQHRGGEERDRDVHGSVSERHRLGQHAGRPRLRPRAARARSNRLTIDVDEIQQRLQQPEYAQVAKSLERDRDELGGRSVLDLRRTGGQTSSRGCGTPASTAIATSGCSTSPGSASTCIRATPSTPTCWSHASRYPDSLFVASDATQRAPARRDRGSRAEGR